MIAMHDEERYVHPAYGALTHNGMGLLHKPCEYTVPLYTTMWIPDQVKQYPHRTKIRESSSSARYSTIVSFHLGISFLLNFVMHFIAFRHISSHFLSIFLTGMSVSCYLKWNAPHCMFVMRQKIPHLFELRHPLELTHLFFGLVNI